MRRRIVSITGVILLIMLAAAVARSQKAPNKNETDARNWFPYQKGDIFAERCIKPGTLQIFDTAILQIKNKNQEPGRDTYEIDTYPENRPVWRGDAGLFPTKISITKTSWEINWLRLPVQGTAMQFKDMLPILKLPLKPRKLQWNTEKPMAWDWRWKGTILVTAGESNTWKSVKGGAVFWALPEEEIEIKPDRVLDFGKGIKKIKCSVIFAIIGWEDPELNYSYPYTFWFHPERGLIKYHPNLTTHGDMGRFSPEYAFGRLRLDVKLQLN